VKQGINVARSAHSARIEAEQIDMAIKNATIVVTGAGRGIGLALVKAALSAGAAKIYAGVRNPAQIAVLEGLDARVKALVFDVSDEAATQKAAAQAADATLLVNNAGVLFNGDALTGSLAELEQTFAINFYGVLFATQAFAPIIEKNGGGAIVNVGSVVSFAPMPVIAGYSASKAAVRSLTLSLRASLAPKGISVHGVYPGPVDTDMARGFDMQKAGAENVAAAILRGVEAGEAEIFPDPMAASVYAGWAADHKAVEAQFAAMI
jgi:NAD(P)-dependent dehydrogenase (short-subunit alcohol dehydrogenase family)